MWNLMTCISCWYYSLLEKVYGKCNESIGLHFTLRLLHRAVIGGNMPYYIWLINHPRRLELDSLFLPWYRQPKHTLYIVFQWRIRGGGGVTGMITAPPPLNLSRYWKPMQSVRDRDRSHTPLGMWMTSHGQCPRGGVLLNVQEWGCSTHQSSDPPPPAGWLATGLSLWSLFTRHQDPRQDNPWLYIGLYGAWRQALRPIIFAPSLCLSISLSCRPNYFRWVWGIRVGTSRWEPYEVHGLTSLFRRTCPAVNLSSPAQTLNRTDSP